MGIGTLSGVSPKGEEKKKWREHRVTFYRAIRCFASELARQCRAKPKVLEDRIIGGRYFECTHCAVVDTRFRFRLMEPSPHALLSMESHVTLKLQQWISVAFGRDFSPRPPDVNSVDTCVDYGRKHLRSFDPYY